MLDYYTNTQPELDLSTQHNKMVNKQYSATDLEAFMKIAANWSNSNHNLLEGVDLKGEMQQYINNPAINMYKKRERTQNWNHQEKKFLLDLCRKDMRIIENKRLDAGLTAVKNKAWKIIHQKFSNAFGTDRTCNRLKEQWRRMKACTRNEILDYNNRLSRFGAEVADRKKPSPFTFEVWDFMQEAKKACKSEALDGIDYSKIPLALEEDFEYREDEQQPDEEHDMDDSRTPPQELCDVDIKEETNETFNDTYTTDSLLNGTAGGGVGVGVGSSGNGGGGIALGVAERLSASPLQRNSMLDSRDSERVGSSGSLHNVLHSPGHASGSEHAAPSGFLPQNGNDMSFQPAFNMNNISATLEALNALRTGQFPTAAAAAAAALQNNFAAAAQQQQQQQQQQQHHHIQHQHQQQSQSQSDEPTAKRLCTSSSTCGSHEELLNNSSSSTTAGGTSSNAAASVVGCANSAELRTFMEMQTKEHMLRMRILEVQLQAAKYSRDIVEINKTLALQKLQEFASKRLS